MRVLPAHPNTVLVELDDLAQTLGLMASLQAEPVTGIDEIIPGARTLLISFDPLTLTRAGLEAELARRPLDLSESRACERVEIPVHYDGEDLAEVAELLKLSPEEVVRRHTGSDWFVAFTGFAPGFAYLSGGDPSLTVPRRKSPRTRIPPGAVALAGGFSGVYPKASPGGWQLLGQTFTPMWDLGRDPPALLQPGQRVRFVDAGPRPADAGEPGTGGKGGAEGAGGDEGAKATEGPEGAEGVKGAEGGKGAEGVDSAGQLSDGGAALEIRNPGLQAVLQDLGRPGQAGQGVAASGAMDRGALRLANRLVGNPGEAACIEVALGGFELVSHGETVVAVTGASGPLTLTTAEGRRWSPPRYLPLALADGDRLAIGSPTAGVRSYLAVRGGLVREPVMGSLSYDTLAEVGLPPLAARDRLAVHSLAQGGIVGQPPLSTPDLPTAAATVDLDVLLGPRTDWFTPAALKVFAEQVWTVTPQSNRVGIRVEGEQPLTRAITDELPSEGTVYGAIQVPASGQPVLFLADHPLTGGYPVIACIAPWHLDLAGQIPVGAKIRFHVVADFDPSEVARR